jgi:hypothetical protein
MFNITFTSLLRSEFLPSPIVFCVFHWPIILCALSPLCVAIGYGCSHTLQGGRRQHYKSETNPGHPPAVDSEDDKWEVEHIASKCRMGRQVWYMLKWKGFPSSENTWQRKGDIHPELIATFEARLRRWRRRYQISEPVG